MKNSAIPDDIRRYVMQRIPSVPYLEAVILMRGAPGAAWSPGLLAERLYTDEEAAAKLLAQLVADGIVQASLGATTTFSYAPASPDLVRVLDELASVYRRNLIEVSTLIHSKAVGKAQILADAFVWRKEK